MLLGVGAADQHGEFISTQARHHVVGTHVFAQAVADGAQHQVAGIVAVAVVDRLEMIQIDQHQRHRLAAALGIGQRHFGALDQVAAVRQLGQRIMEGGMLQALFAFAQLLIGLGQLGGTQAHRLLQVVGAGLHLRQACAFLAIGLPQGLGLLLFEHLDAVGQGEGEQDRLGRHGQREHVGVPGGRLDQAGRAHQGQADAAEDQAVAAQVEQGGEVALAPAHQCRAECRRDAGQRQQGNQPGGQVALAEAFQGHGDDIADTGKAQQVMRPAHVLAGLQQRLGEAAGAEAPQRRQGDAVQPERHRALRPQVLEAMAAHADDHQQGAGGGQHVPEIGVVAQGEEDEQVVQQQGGDDAVDQAQAQVFADRLVIQVFQLPDPQREGVAGRIEAAQVEGGGCRAQLRQLQDHASIGVVAPFGEADPFAGLPLYPATLAVRAVQLQVELGHRADFQPPARRCLGATLQLQLDPPRVGILADAGAAVGRGEALLDGRVGHVGDAQRAADILQQLDLPVQRLPAGVTPQFYRRSP